ncbi:TetR/AcrR family transcriptional regulator [Thalassomonas actiniarum]|uniref:TetR/AcrR family transcriptional regulator n=1 Tax=Thalassomonas actiniarum TaxID=485447 RepID=A0AAE9YSP4_9GAMM|nr:TetR/AcrR family transcriptional regulator [Thalassomonas actiniarum]WDD98846.1 TetR/AcrR family transcriptional regulator [Thalassomonas actiniarum]
MANKVKFDRDEVIDKATLLFWQQGFGGTSMRDLQQHLDMRPGSIYASFGSKDNLFKEVIKCYGEQCLQALECFQLDASSPLAGLKSFIHHVTLGEEEPGQCRLCLLAKTLSELPAEQQELIAAAQQALLLVEDKFEQILLRARELQELSPGADCQRLAKWLQMQLMGLRAYAKSQVGKAELEMMIDDIFTSLKSR